MTKRESELMMKGWDKEISAFKTELAAWHALFGTTQLSHAVAERDRLRRENAQLAAALLVVKKYADSWRGFPNDVAIVLEQHATALRDLLAPTFVLLENMKRTGITADELGAELSRLRALVKEGQ